MKKKILLAAGLLCMCISFHSCDDLKDCEICQQNTYDNSSGDLLNEGSETEYCGAELVSIKATPDVNVGGRTTKWECR
ncbi:MAG TPA: hypothetical protein VHO46_02710 [Bacteroidales bacterium]|nr:hypothetical protein [Bacteroidales bacterium]